MEKAPNVNQTKFTTVSTSKNVLKKLTTSYPWVVYDERKQRASCFVYKTAADEKIIFPHSATMSLNSKKAFVDVGFCNWNTTIEWLNGMWEEFP